APQSILGVTLIRKCRQYQCATETQVGFAAWRIVDDGFGHPNCLSRGLSAKIQYFLIDHLLGRRQVAANLANVVLRAIRLAQLIEQPDQVDRQGDSRQAELPSLLVVRHRAPQEPAVSRDSPGRNPRLLQVRIEDLELPCE